MAKPNLSAELSDADKVIIKTNIQESRNLMPWLVNLSNEERKSLRKTGSKRAGYVADVYDTSIANPGALPEDFKLIEWTKDEMLYKQLTEVREVISTFMESVDDTILYLGYERISQADNAYGHLKQSAKKNTAITNELERIARQFDGAGRMKNLSTFTIAANTEVEVKNVVSGKRLVNSGTTVLQFKGGADLANKLKMSTIVINPGNSALIPKGCNIIVVINTSLDTEGAFSVKTK
jgi:hypothetical protein